MRGESGGRRFARPPTPLVGPAIALMCGIAASRYLMWIPSDALLVGPAFGALLYAIIRVAPPAKTWRNRAATTAVLLTLAWIGAARHRFAVSLPPTHVAHFTGVEPKLMRVAGLVVTEPHWRPGALENIFSPVEPPGRTELVLDARELRNDDAIPLSGLIRVSVKAPLEGFGAGDSLVVTGWLYRPSPPRNPGGRDWAAELRLIGIHAGLSVPDVRLVARDQTAPTNWRRAVSWLRARGRAFLLDASDASSGSDESAELLDAMVLGQRSTVSRALNEAFVRTGTVHLLSVSGFHVALLAACSWWLALKLARGRRDVAAAATMSIIVIYALIAEQNAPILRATVAGVLLCLCRLRGRSFNAVNSLALAAIMVLMITPLELFRAGFQLSFLQVAALILAAGPIFERLQAPSDPLVERQEPLTAPAALRVWIRRNATAAAVAAFTAWAAATPLTMYHFEQFNPWGALQSLLILPAATLTVLTGFATILAGSISQPAGAALGALAELFSRFLIWSAERLGDVPGSAIRVQSPPALLVFAGCLAPFIAGRVARAAAELLSSHRDDPSWRRLHSNWKRERNIAVIAGVALTTAWMLQLYGESGRPPIPSPELVVLSVGHGSGAILALPSRSGVVFDLGTIDNHDVGRTAAHAARAIGVNRVPIAIVSHANFDHYSGIPSFAAEMPIRFLYVNASFERDDDRGRGPRLLPALAGRVESLRTLRLGDELDLRPADAPPDCRVRVLWPPDHDTRFSNNESSLVLSLRVGTTSVLISGDVEKSAMQALVDQNRFAGLELAADVLIAPHHGGIETDVTDAFYRAVSPRLVVVSTNRERERLKQLIRRVLGPQCSCITTHESGAVRIRFDPTGFRISTTVSSD